MKELKLLIVLFWYRFLLFFTWHSSKNMQLIFSCISKCHDLMTSVIQLLRVWPVFFRHSSKERGHAVFGILKVILYYYYYYYFWTMGTKCPDFILQVNQHNHKWPWDKYSQFALRKWQVLKLLTALSKWLWARTGKLESTLNYRRFLLYLFRLSLP